MLGHLPPAFKAPTRWQRFVASGLPIKAWFIAGQIVGIAVLLHTLRPPLVLPTDVWFLMATLTCLLLTAAVTWHCSLLLGFFVLGPFFYGQGRANGGPFRPGDRVIVLAGRKAGRESVVYETWQHETVRVRLDPEDELDFEDIFADYELLRLASDDSKLSQQPTDK